MERGKHLIEKHADLAHDVDVRLFAVPADVVRGSYGAMLEAGAKRAYVILDE
jgi:hypothetical protein